MHREDQIIKEVLGEDDEEEEKKKQLKRAEVEFHAKQAAAKVAEADDSNKKLGGLTFMLQAKQ